MARRAAALNPPCPRCGHHPTVANGHSRGHRRYRCPGCQHSFGTTTGTVMARLKTPAPEVARALLVVVHRGSLRAAEAVTGHKYETIGRWLQRAGAQADALTEALVQDLHLGEVEVDEFWSFVHHKGGAMRRTPARSRANPAPRRPTAEAGSAGGV